MECVKCICVWIRAVWEVRCERIRELVLGFIMGHGLDWWGGVMSV